MKRDSLQEPSIKKSAHIKPTETKLYPRRRNQQGKKLTSMEKIEGGFRTHFEDDTFTEETILVEASGSNSNVCRYLLPHDYALNPLPASLKGHFSPEQAASVRALDPLLFQGLHPKTGKLLWYDILDYTYI